MSIKLREQRGGFQESLKTLKTFDKTEDLIGCLRGLDCTVITSRGIGYDNREGWNDNLFLIKGYSKFGTLIYIGFSNRRIFYGK